MLSIKTFYKEIKSDRSKWLMLISKPKHPLKTFNLRNNRYHFRLLYLSSALLMQSGISVFVQTVSRVRIKGMFVVFLLFIAPFNNTDADSKIQSSTDKCLFRYGQFGGSSQLPTTTEHCFVI